MDNPYEDLSWIDDLTWNEDIRPETWERFRAAIDRLKALVVAIDERYGTGPDTSRTTHDEDTE